MTTSPSRTWIDGSTTLQPSRGGTARERDAWYVSDRAILEFIKSYPLEFELRRVDAWWFMDLILSGGLVRRALRGLEREKGEAA